MPVSSPRKALAAMATALAVVVFMATPASADPPYEFRFTAGTFVIESAGSAPDIVFTIGEEPEEDPCDLYDPTDPTLVEVNIAGTGPNYTTSIVPSIDSPGGPSTAPDPTGQLGKATFEDTSTDTWYQVDLDISDPNVTGADNTGTLTGAGSGTWTITQNAWIEVRLFDVGSSPTPWCEKDDLVCSLLVVFDANVTNPLYGTYTGSVPPTASTAISSLGGIGATFVNGSCDAGLAGSYDGAEARLTGGALSFVP